MRPFQVDVWRDATDVDDRLHFLRPAAGGSQILGDRSQEFFAVKMSEQTAGSPVSEHLFFPE